MNGMGSVPHLPASQFEKEKKNPKKSQSAPVHASTFKICDEPEKQ